MSEHFVRMSVEIPLSLYANLDKITNGSAASGRILDAVKKHQERPVGHCPECGARMDDEGKKERDSYWDETMKWHDRLEGGRE